MAAVIGVVEQRISNQGRIIRQPQDLPNFLVQTMANTVVIVIGDVDNDPDDKVNPGLTLSKRRYTESFCFL